MDDGPRARIPDVLDANPGASTRMVAAALSLDDSTVDYHLRRLRREGKVLLQRQGRETCWFNAGKGVCPVLRRMVPAVRSPGIARVVLALDDAWQPATGLAERAGVSVGQARWAISVLAASGLLERSLHGRVRLADGADVCVKLALAEKRCDAWGECPVSQRLSRCSANPLQTDSPPPVRGPSAAARACPSARRGTRGR